MLAVEELTKRYGTHLAVDHLTFTVEGGVFGFLGPNGAGKTTTMNMMTGYLEPTGGRVVVDGADMERQSLAAKAKLGYLPEQPPLYGDMTVGEYLSFAAQLKRVPRREIMAQVDKAQARTDLTGVSGRLIRNLSKGYRQRVGLAMALLGSPRLLILDEPTVGLDPKQILEIRELIRDLAQEHTVILSSHILSEVREVCDQILILHHGRAVAQGAPAQLELEMAGEPWLSVTLRGDPDRAMAVLSALPGAERAEPIPGQSEGQAAFRLTVAPGVDLREAVFHACVEADLPLLELRPQRATLEDVFLRLTTDEPSSAPAEEELDGEEEPIPTAQGPSEELVIPISAQPPDPAGEEKAYGETTADAETTADGEEEVKRDDGDL